MRFGPDDETAFQERKAELTAGFDTWLRRRGVPEDALAPAVGDLGLLLDWRWGYGDGNLGRWDESDLEEFLLAWCPRKVSASAELAQAMPADVGMMMLFLGSSGLLQRGSSAASALDEHARSLADRFVREMSSPQNYGLAKSLFAGLDQDIDDLDLDDPSVLEGLMEQFNALPDDERAAILDPAAAPLTRTPPSAPVLAEPFPDEVTASAEASGLLAAFDVVAEYFVSPGTPLTKTKAIKIADAVALAELLGTGEKPVDEIGDRTFRKSSSREFGQVDFWVSYARAAGALRHHRGRMVSVQAWRQRRRKDPAGEAVKAGAMLLASGPLAVRSGYYTQVDELLDLAVIPMLITLAGDGELPIEEIVTRSREVLDHAQLSEFYPGELPRALVRQLNVLHDCGLVRTTPSPAAAPGESRASLLAPPDLTGSAAVTPLGVQTVIDVAGRLGLPITLAPGATEQTVAGLVGLLSQVSDPGTWWGFAGAWLDAQPDYRAAARALLEAVCAESLAILTGVLDKMPADQAERMTPLLWQLARAVTSPEDEVGLAAASWLVERDDAAAQLDQVTTFSAAVAALGASCDLGAEDDAVAAVTRLPDDAAAEFLTQVGGVISPRAVTLLEAVARLHPDQQLAKRARKELFRLRSRLATTQR